MMPRPMVLSTFVFFLGAIVLAPSAASESTTDTCAECHEDVSTASLSDSVHGGFDCVDCHAEIDAHLEGEAIPWVDCSVCHDDVSEAYAASIHGQKLGDGVDEAPKCQTCHGDPHGILPASEPASPVHPDRLADTCASCHSDPSFVEKFDIPRVQPIEAYRASVHARLVEEGLPGPTCNDCHDSHAIYPGFDPRSSVNHRRVPETCGQCHSDIVEVYNQSVHGVDALQGIPEAPVCTDCHGEHRILSPASPEAPTFATNVPKMTCERCHSDLTLAEKFGLDMSKVANYEDSYHGLASRSGRITVANCGSCHGVHDVLPSSDPRSSIHPDNLPETCGQCHPGAGTRFAIGEIHVSDKDREHTAVYWIREIYIWLIFGTIGGMILHNLLDLYRKTRYGVPRAPRDVPDEGERMTLGFRIAHMTLIVSFALLVWSGFALKYPDAWWAGPLRSLRGFDVRGILHRVAAVGMLLALAIHVVHVIVDRSARKVIRSMIPTVEDVREFVDRMRWYVGLRKDPPHAPKLGYPEKAEYLALMWGIVVMTVTGFVLWFENWTLRALPGWAPDVATAIHFYEAILATLAILVWHFYFVLLDPVVYPMDPAWLRGRAHAGRVAERAGIARPDRVSRDPVNGGGVTGRRSERPAH